MFGSFIACVNSAMFYVLSLPQLPVAAIHESVAAARSSIVFVGVFGQVAQVVCLHVVAVHHVLARGCATASRVRGGIPYVPRKAAPVALVAASSALHAQASLETREAVCGDSVDFAVVAAC